MINSVMESSKSHELTISLASQDVRRVLDKQKEERQMLLTQTNILFSLFSVTEIVLFLINFSLLINALLPRQFVVTPNLESGKFLEGYLAMAPEEYQLQMLVNLVETYNANRQPLNDISQSLFYAACVTWGIALVVSFHLVAVYVVPDLHDL